MSILELSVAGVMKGLDTLELDDPGGVMSVDRRGREKLTTSPETIGAKLTMFAQSPLRPGWRLLGIT